MHVCTDLRWITASPRRATTQGGTAVYAKAGGAVVGCCRVPSLLGCVCTETATPKKCAACFVFPFFYG